MKNAVRSRPLTAAPLAGAQAGPRCDPLSDAWLGTAALALLAAVLVVPSLMSVAMERSYEIAKLAALIPLAALALAAIAMAGKRAAWRALWEEQRWPCLALVALACAVTGSALLSDSPALALYGTHARREGWIVWLAYFVFFCTAAITLRDPGGSGIGRLIDALLLSSIIPAAYALQQRVGLDFFVTPLADPGRSAGTFGNPNFLAGYLALLLPLTVARAWCARAVHAGPGAAAGFASGTALSAARGAARGAAGGAAHAPWGEAALWWWLAGWQCLALLQTQSRGPLLALLVALGFFACLAAARAGARKLLAIAAGVSLAVLLFIVLLNVHAPLTQWARDMPVLSRLIFAVPADAGAATLLAARSVNARLGIWQAAADAFAAAPLGVQLIGFGPDAAHTHFLPHVPPQLMTSEGYQQASTFDRTHADLLEIALSFGLLGALAWVVFFGTVLFAALRALLGLSDGTGGTGGSRYGGSRHFSATPAWAFAAISVGCGVLGAAAAAGAGLRAAAPPAFGLGLTLGALGWTAWQAWSGLRRGVSVRLTAAWAALAGLAAALLVYWIDAQINIPVVATRLAGFALAAAVLVQARVVARANAMTETMTAALTTPAAPASSTAAPALMSGWYAGIASIAGISGFFGIFFDEVVRGPGWQLWFLKLPSIVVLMCFCACVGWYEAGRCGMPRAAALARFLVWLVLPALVFSGGLALLGIMLESAAAPALPAWIASLTLWCMALLLAMGLLAAHPLARGAVPKPGAVRAAPHRRVWMRAVGGIGLLAASGWFCWQQVTGDVAFNLAEWARRNGRPEARALYLELAVRAMPHERHYLRRTIFDALERAALRLPQARGPAGWRYIQDELALAETRARQTLARYPHDPWLVVALANVRGHQALSMLRPLDPAAGAAAAAEARELYEQARRLYPAQPLVYLGWAQLEFDQGDITTAYRLLDSLEHLIPASIDPYRERVLMARAAGDTAAVEATLARAAAKLTPVDVDALRVVASIQR